MTPLSLHLAWRYLRRHPGRRRFAFTSAVSIAGVTLGVSALIVVMSILSGVEKFIGDSVVAVDAPLTILPAEGPSFDLPDSVMRKIPELPQVEHLSPYVEGEAILRMPSRGLERSCRLRGVDPEMEFSRGRMRDRLSYGSLELISPEGGYRILMGLYLAEGFLHSVGDTVYIFPPKAFFSRRGGTIGTAVLEGAMETGLPANDETMAWIHIDLARKLFLPRGGYSGIKVYPSPGTAPGSAEDALTSLLPPEATVKSWKELNPHLAASMKLERMGAFLALLLITLVATFNIMGTIARSATERRRDISVLKAMGAENSLIFKVFLWEGVIVGASGIVLGTALGLAGCWFIGDSGMISLPDIYSFHENIPVVVSPAQVLLVTVIAFLLSLSSGVLPAMKAAGSDPVRGLES